MNKDIQFLKELQEELRTQDKDMQAAPRFWSIMDYKWIPTTPDYADDTFLYDAKSYRTIDIQDYVNQIIDSNGERYSEFDKNQRSKLSEIFKLDNQNVIFSWIEDNDDFMRYYPIYMKKIQCISYNTCFFSKKEAKWHLENNKHHYSDEAHTYAMTAWRAPKMERLMNILENFNWDTI